MWTPFRDLSSISSVKKRRCTEEAWSRTCNCKGPSVPFVDIRKALAQMLEKAMANHFVEEQVYH